MYLIEESNRIVGISSQKPAHNKYHEVEEGNEFHQFLSGHHPYTYVAVTDDGTMYYKDDENRKRVQEEIDSKKAKEEKIRDLKVTTASGLVFDAGETSQARMANAILSVQLKNESTVEWKMADNTKLQITVDDLIEAFTLATDKLSSILLE